MLLALGAGVCPLTRLALAEDAGIPDPVQAFVEGYDPSESDFFIHAPEATTLRRIRWDFDNDGIADLAISEESTWGKGGGPWLIFLGDRAGKYSYVGELFFAPGNIAIKPLKPGTSKVTVYVGLGAETGEIHEYLCSRAGIKEIRSESWNETTAEDRAKHAAFLSQALPVKPAETCRLLEYRQDKERCWRSGPGPK